MVSHIYIYTPRMAVTVHITHHSSIPHRSDLIVYLILLQLMHWMTKYPWGKHEKIEFTLQFWDDTRIRMLKFIRRAVLHFCNAPIHDNKQARTHASDQMKFHSLNLGCDSGLCVRNLNTEFLSACDNFDSLS